MPKADFIDPDATARPVFVLSDRHHGTEVPWHSHRRAQLLHVSAGALTVITRRARFVIPPQRAVWIGPGVEHRIASRAAFWLTTCYVEPGLVDLPEGVQAVAVDRLTDELLIAASLYGGDYPETGSEARLMAVLLDRIPVLKPMNIFLPEPVDTRLQRITERLVGAPDCNEPLAVLSADAGLTERTAARLFLKETGMTFGRWRQHLKLQAALETLSAGASVTEAAFAVGYSDVSSFIAAFKRLFGKTPSQILSR